MRNRVIFALLFVSGLSLWAQEKPRIRIIPLQSAGFSDEEVKNIEFLLSSYLDDFGTVISSGDFEYTVGGRLRLEDNSRFLDLDITNEASGENYPFSYPFKNNADLVLKIRSVISSAFPVQKTSAGEILSHSLVSGTWRSGGSIQMIRLERNGTGMLLFSSGVTMKLRYHIEENALKVFQDSPNNERFYHPLPKGIAAELAEKAEPMRWELMLFEKGTALRGFCFYTEADYEGEILKGLNHGKQVESEWQKNH
jgi:hypothetical protein